MQSKEKNVDAGATTSERSSRCAGVFWRAVFTTCEGFCIVQVVDRAVMAKLALADQQVLGAALILLLN